MTCKRKSIPVAAIEVAIEKLAQAAIRIVRGRAVVLQPVIEHRPAGLEILVIKSMVRAGIDDELDRRPVAAPAGDTHANSPTNHTHRPTATKEMRLRARANRDG